MITLIFGKTTESGIMFLENLIKKINPKEIKYKNKTLVKLHNKDVYIVVPAMINTKCCFCDKVYIEKGIDDNIVKYVIYPLLSKSKLPLESKISWFDNIK